MRRPADVNAKDRNGMTALHHEARNGHIEVVRLLLDKGANVDARDQVGITLLALAASRGRSPVVQLLFERGGDVNAFGVDPDDEATVLASRIVRINAIKLLLARGANVHLKDKDGKTPLQMARELRELVGLEAERLLEKHGADE